MLSLWSESSGPGLFTGPGRLGFIEAISECIRVMADLGFVLAMDGRASDATEMLICGITAYRKTGGTLFLPFHLPRLARAHAERGQFDEAWRCIDEATNLVETTKQKWCEAEVNRVAGE